MSTGFVDGVSFSARTEWYGMDLSARVDLDVTKKLHLAAMMLRDRVVVNLSTPVRKYQNARGRIVVDPTSRSRIGQFPRADTTRLMKDIFFHVDEGRQRAIVGTTLDYGLELEIGGRSFLRRTLDEMRPALQRMFRQ